MSEKTLSIQQDCDAVFPFARNTDLGPENRLKLNAYVVFAADLDNARRIAAEDGYAGELVAVDYDEAMRWVKA